MMRSSPFSVLIKPVSADCNLDCQYCFYRPKAALYPEPAVHRMSDETLSALVQQVMRLSGHSASFGWQGGEPTLVGLDFFRRAVELQAASVRDGQVVANGLQTNAVVIDDDLADFLAQYRFLVVVSVDGPQPMHDHFRGKGTHARVMRALKALRRHSVEHNALIMVTPRNVAAPEEVYEFCQQEKLHYLQFIHCAERDPQTGEIAGFSVAPEDYGDFLCRVFDRWSAEDPPRTYVRLFDDLLAVHLGYQMPSCSLRDACGDYVVVEWNGDVYACDFFVEPEWKLGNLLETPLEAMIGSPLWARFRNRKSRHTGRCVSCGWLSLCHGECPKYRLVAHPGDDSGPSYFCEAYRKFFAYSQRRYTELARRGPRMVGAP